MSFSDNVPEETLFLEPGELPLRLTGQMQVLLDGSRAMRSAHWSTGYRVLPAGGSARGITGESYWATGATSPMLAVEFERDSRGLVSREILRIPQGPDSEALSVHPRVLGRYEYVRNDQGQLRQLIYRLYRRDDGRPSDEDPILSTAEIDYGLDDRNPREAIISRLHTKGRQSSTVRFEYDAGGRLVGGTRRDAGLTYSSFAVTSGACEAVPERLFVILLSTLGGPWYPIYGRGAASPR